MTQNSELGEYQRSPDLVKELEEVKKEIKDLQASVYKLQHAVRDLHSATTRAR